MPSSMGNLPAMVRTKVFEKLDGESIKNARLVCWDWNEEILGWAALQVIVDESDADNVRFLSQIGLIGNARIVCLKCDGETRSLVDIIQKATFSHKVGVSVIREIFYGKRLKVLQLRERFVYQGFNATSFMRFPPMISYTLRELRFLLPFLGRPPNKLNEKLHKDMSLLLNNIVCPQLNLLEIKETDNCIFKVNQNSSFGSMQLVNVERCWDYEAIRNFLTKHSSTLKRVLLSPLRSFPLPPHLPEFPVNLKFLNLDILTLYPCGAWHYWDEFLSSQRSLQGICLDLKAMNFHLPEGAQVVWPPRSMSAFTQVNAETLTYISISCSGCKVNHHWRDLPSFIDGQVFQPCRNLDTLILARKFTDGESYRTFGFPRLTGVEFLPGSLKRLRLKNIVLSSREFASLASLKQIEQIYWTTSPKVSFVFAHPNTLLEFFQLRQLNSLNFPINMEAYELLLEHREICNVFHGAETGMGTGNVDIPDILF